MGRCEPGGRRPSRWLAVLMLVGLGGPAIGQEAGPAEEPAAEAVVDALTEPPVGAEVDGGADAEERSAADPSQGVGRASVLAVLRDANPMLIPLVLCSVVTLGFTLERVVALRRRRVIPKEFVERFLERLSGGKLDRDRAAELCRAHDSPVARVFGHAIRYWGQPATTIRQAVDSDAATEVADMRRNVRVLNGTATLAPLLGLLGTVVGLIEAFDSLGGAAAEGMGKGEALAHGISLALVATAFGLGIAIVSVIAYYYLLSRIDTLVRDLDEQVRRVIELVAGESWPGADRRIGAGMTAAERARPESRAV